MLLAAMAGEHERAAGAWHSEWTALTDALALAGGAAAAMAEALDGLEVRPERMAANLDATGGLVMAESASLAIAGSIGRERAHWLVAEASKRAVQAGRPLREELLDDDRVREHLSEDEIDSALDPAGYVGAAGAFVDRALDRYREQEGKL